MDVGYLAIEVREGQNIMTGHFEVNVKCTDWLDSVIVKIKTRGHYSCDSRNDSCVIK